MENYDNVVSYVHIPLVPLMQEQSETERRASISLAAGVDEGQPAGVRSLRSEAESYNQYKNYGCYEN